MAKIKEILGEIQERNDKVCAIWDKVDKEQSGEATKEQLEDVKRLNKEIEQLELRATEVAEGEAMRLAAEQRKEELKKRARLVLPEGGKGDGPPNPSPEYRDARQAVLSPGRHVFENPQFRAWQQEMNRRGGPSKDEAVRSPRVELRTLITGASDTSAGALVVTDRQPGIVNAAPFQPLTIYDLITMGETESDLVEYVRFNSWTNNAAPVPEATATGDGSGAKPESAMDFLKVTADVKTIAHWIPATNRSLADAAQIRTLIDTFLRYGLRAAIEYLIVNGDGTGENFLGILNTPGVLTQAYTTDLITTTRKARTKLQLQGRVAPTAYLMNPADWETFDLLKDGENRYYWGGPSILGQPRLWGLPVAENESLAAGNAILANWMFAILWQRMQAAITVSNSHADFFVRNLVAILAEERAAFGILYPKAFEIVDLTP